MIADGDRSPLLRESGSSADKNLTGRYRRRRSFAYTSSAGSIGLEARCEIRVVWWLGGLLASFSDSRKIFLD